MEDSQFWQMSHQQQLEAEQYEAPRVTKRIMEEADLLISKTLTAPTFKNNSIKLIHFCRINRYDGILIIYVLRGLNNPVQLY